MGRFVKRYLKKIIGTKVFLDSKVISTIQVALLNLIEGSNKVIYKIKPLHDLTPHKKILLGYCYQSKSQGNLEVIVPDLNLYKFKDALVNSRSSTIINGGNIYYETINDNERFNEGFIKHHTQKNALVHHIITESIEEGFFLAGNGSFNWYHWMIEILPKMLYFDRSDTTTILVDESCKEIASMKDSLLAFTENLNIKIIYLNPAKTYKVKKLYFINEVNNLIFNKLDNKKEDSPLYYFREESLKKFSAILKDKFTDESLSAEKIYLKRQNIHRIAKNDNEVSQILLNFNFDSIDLVKCSLNKQVSTFNKAKKIVGITGAAWTNIIFCEPGTNIIIFMPNNYKEYLYYGEIGNLLSLNLVYLYYKNGSANHDSSDFVINEDELIKLLQN